MISKSDFMPFLKQQRRIVSKFYFKQTLRKQRKEIYKNNLWERQIPKKNEIKP